MTKVLVVDDGEDILEYLRMVLTDKGFNVVTAKDGEDALLRYKESEPNIIVSDYKMPKMNGIELYLKITDESADFPFVFLTGYGGELRGVDENYLVMDKPPEIDSLVDAIHKVIEGIPKRRGAN